MTNSGNVDQSNENTGNAVTANVGYVSHGGDASASISQSNSATPVVISGGDTTDSGNVVQENENSGNAVVANVGYMALRFWRFWRFWVQWRWRCKCLNFTEELCKPHRNIWRLTLTNSGNVDESNENSGNAVAAT